MSVPVSNVYFSTRDYEASTGKAPRGYGSWAFVAYDRSRTADYLDHVKWFSGTYGSAKREAAKAFAAQGVTDVVVLS